MSDSRSERIDPEEASSRMAAGWTYVDVRSAAEFALGHPTGAINIALASGADASAESDAAFVADVQTRFSPNDRLILGCASGKRSARATLLLDAAGFVSLADQLEGYDGQRDAFGSRIVQGWRGRRLPCEAEPRASVPPRKV